MSDVDYELQAEILENLPVSALLMSKKGNLLYTNKTCTKEFGYILNLHSNVYADLNFVCEQKIDFENNQGYFDIGAKHYKFMCSDVSYGGSHLRTMCILDKTEINKGDTNNKRHAENRADCMPTSPWLPRPLRCGIKCQRTNKHQNTCQ